VYPGTSGAAFLDFVAVDAVVAPAEHAYGYSEAMLVLPPTYQISFFDRHVAGPVGDADTDRLALRRRYGLPTDPGHVVFCNFNKVREFTHMGAPVAPCFAPFAATALIAFPPVVALAVQVDKLDRPTFALWMAVMRRVPHSTLWLLRPSKSRGVHDTFAWAEHNALVERNLRRAAAVEGVHPSRLVFTGRENKTEHILRHAAADLFLDSLVYGAHSTATDALRGGLPVLTILGDSFPSRVAASLYASFPASPLDKGQGGADGEENLAARLLVRQSQQDFEDAAVALVARGSPALRRIRA